MLAVLRAPLRAAGVPAIGLALLWLIAAVVRPELTFHLAPALVAAAPAVSLILETATEQRGIATATLVGLLTALVATTVIAAFGWMQGPSLLSFGGPALEATLFALAGAAVGLGAAFGVRALR